MQPTKRGRVEHRDVITTESHVQSHCSNLLRNKRSRAEGPRRTSEKRGARCGGNPRKIARNVERLQRCVVPDDHAQSFFRPRRRCAVRRSCFVRKMTTALVKKQQQTSSKRATKFHRSSEGTRLKHQSTVRSTFSRKAQGL